jgi:hypothetical protein
MVCTNWPAKHATGNTLDKWDYRHNTSNNKSLYAKHLDYNHIFHSMHILHTTGKGRLLNIIENLYIQPIEWQIDHHPQHPLWHHSASYTGHWHNTELGLDFHIQSLVYQPSQWNQHTTPFHHKEMDIKHPRDIHRLCHQPPSIQQLENPTTNSVQASHRDYPIRSM